MTLLTFDNLRVLAKECDVDIPVDEKTEVADFDKVTNWLLTDFQRLDTAKKQKIADGLREFEINLDTNSDTLYEDIKQELLLNLLNSADQTETRLWLEKYDSSNTLTLTALGYLQSAPELFAPHNILALLRNISDPGKRLNTITEIREIKFLKNNKDLQTNLAELYATTAVEREKQTGVGQPAWDPNITLNNLSSNTKSIYTQLGNITFIALEAKYEKSVLKDALFEIYNHFINKHGNHHAAFTREGAFFLSLQGKLADYYGIDMINDVMVLDKDISDVITQRRNTESDQKRATLATVTLGVMPKHSPEHKAKTPSVESTFDHKPPTLKH